MKIKNTTDWPDYFLRRLVAWCCRELQMPARNIREAVFRNRTGFSYSGHCDLWGRIVVSIYRPMKPVIEEITGKQRAGQEHLNRILKRSAMAAMVDPVHLKTHKFCGCYCERSEAEKRVRDWTPQAERAQCINDLVRVTAHECAHRMQTIEKSMTRRHGKRQGGSERRTCKHERDVLAKFMANRDALLAAWNEPPKTNVTPKLNRAEKNEAKARKLLDAWKRKLKLAKTKVSTYRSKVRRYNRIAATKGGA